VALRLDRVEIESVGSNPVRLAAAILKQLPDLTGAVPVHDIAYALDIEEIREDRVRSFEGCLLTDRDKSYGSILVNSGSSQRRRRYTIGHELMHFLSERHEPTEDQGFVCTKVDMLSPSRVGQHLRQEEEANTFAIELLAPEQLIKKYLVRAADLEHVIAISNERDISREAAVRRYVDLHEDCLAVVFTDGRRIRYVHKGEAFPATRIWMNDQAPPLPPRPTDGTELTAMDEVSAALWLSSSDGTTLFAQTLRQEGQYATTLLLAEFSDEDEEE
jgi:Zn-dependent peptidase ImmA (M78 family)